MNTGRETIFTWPQFYYTKYTSYITYIYFSTGSLRPSLRTVSFSLIYKYYT